MPVSDPGSPPIFSDISPTSSAYTPGTPEWYQDQLKGNYDQPILIGIPNPNPATSERRPGRRSNFDIPANDTAKSQDIYKHYLSLATSDPNKYLELQSQLYDGHFFGAMPRTSVPWGLATDETFTALRQAISSYLAVANATDIPITWTEFLEQQAHQGRINQQQGGVGGAGGAGQTAPPPINLADPEALRQSAEQAAQAALGHGFAPDQLQKFVEEFQSRQTAQQSAQTGTVTVPDMTADAIRYAQQSDEQGYSNHQATAYTNAFLNMFLPGASSRPNIQPVSRA